MKSLKIQLKTQMHSLKIQNKKRKRRAWPLNHWVWKIKTLRIIFVHEINTWFCAKTRYGYVNLKNTGLNQAFVVKTDQNDAENASERPVSPQITQNVRREKLRGENQQGKNATKMKTKTFPGCFRARKMPKNVQKILTRSKRLKMRCEAGFFYFWGTWIPSRPLPLLQRSPSSYRWTRNGADSQAERLSAAHLRWLDFLYHYARKGSAMIGWDDCHFITWQHPSPSWHSDMSRMSICLCVLVAFFSH